MRPRDGGSLLICMSIALAWASKVQANNMGWGSNMAQKQQDAQESGDQYSWLQDNPFQKPADHPGVMRGDGEESNSEPQSGQPPKPYNDRKGQLQSPAPNTGYQASDNNPPNQGQYPQSPNPYYGGQPQPTPANGENPVGCDLVNKADCHQGGNRPNAQQRQPFNQGVQQTPGQQPYSYPGQNPNVPSQNYAPPAPQNQPSVSLPSYSIGSDDDPYQANVVPSYPPPGSKSLSPNYGNNNNNIPNAGGPPGPNPNESTPPGQGYKPPGPPSPNQGYQQPQTPPKNPYQQPQQPQDPYQQPQTQAFPPNTYQQPLAPPQNAYQQPPSPPQNAYQQPPQPQIPYQQPQTQTTPQNPYQAPQSPPQNPYQQPQAPPQNPYQQPQAPPQNPYQQPQGYSNPSQGYQQPPPSGPPARPQGGRRFQQSPNKNQLNSEQGRPNRPQNQGPGQRPPSPQQSGQNEPAGEQLPYPGCPAAMMCVTEDHCNVLGVIEEEQVTLSEAEKLHRVALSVIFNNLRAKYIIGIT